jgi:hAT family C-terminal dimerisation region
MLIGTIQINKTEFPTLFTIALDYLPIQASSVPCERVFSFAKETDTVKCNRIHPVLMEALQTLKFLLKKEQFNFTSGWQTAPSKMKRMGNAGTTKDLLAHLLTGDRQATTDALLHALSDGDDDDDDDDDGNGDDDEIEDELHNDDVEDDDNDNDNE